MIDDGSCIVHENSESMVSMALCGTETYGSWRWEFWIGSLSHGMMETKVSDCDRNRYSSFKINFRLEKSIEAQATAAKIANRKGRHRLIAS